MLRLENIERIGNIIKAHVQICQMEPEYFDIEVVQGKWICMSHRQSQG